MASLGDRIKWIEQSRCAAAVVPRMIVLLSDFRHCALG